MDVSQQTHLNAFRQNPASDLSYSESLTLEMLKDLQKLRKEGASNEEIQHRISETRTKLEQHTEAIDRKITVHSLAERRKNIQCCLDSIQAFKTKFDSMEKSVSTLISLFCRFYKVTITLTYFRLRVVKTNGRRLKMLSLLLMLAF